MNAPERIPELNTEAVDGGEEYSHQLLHYYEAIEHASHDMLDAAREGDWDRVFKLESACAVLIAQLKHAASVHSMGPEELQLKTRIMQRILVNDAEIRNLAEHWLGEISRKGGAQDSGFLH